MCFSLIYIYIYINGSILNMIAGINKSKLSKYIRKCVTVTQIKSGTMINVGVSVKIWKKIVYGKNCVWNPATCSCEYGKYEGSIIDNSAVIYDENIRNKNCSKK